MNLFELKASESSATGIGLGSAHLPVFNRTRSRGPACTAIFRPAISVAPSGWNAALVQSRATSRAVNVLVNELGTPLRTPRVCVLVRHSHLFKFKSDRWLNWQVVSAGQFSAERSGTLKNSTLTLATKISTYGLLPFLRNKILIVGVIIKY